jgi:hypothetical protein
MKLFKTVLVFCCFTCLPSFAQTLSGIIKEKNTGEAIIGANVSLKNTKLGSSTNQYGFFSISVPKATYTIKISAVGFQNYETTLDLSKNQEIKIELLTNTTELNEVAIIGNNEYGNKQASNGIEKLTLKTIKKMPAMMGETDVVRSLLTLPGVSTVGEGASGFNVRGGNTDQNLVLLDGLPIYNSSHLFGFFSSFNADAIKDVTLYKGDIPSQYGGRSSSVLNIKLKDGNNNKLTVEGGISPISSKLLLSGPLGSKKTSFILAGRGSFAKPYLSLVPDKNIKKSEALFYDFTGKISHHFNDKNSLFLTAYSTADQFKFPADTSYNYSTNAAILRYNLQISPKIQTSLSVGNSIYNYGSTGNTPNNQYEWTAGINTLNAKSETYWYYNTKNEITFGAELFRTTIKPGAIKPFGNNSAFNQATLQSELSNEISVFVNDNLKLTDKLNVSLGLRYNMFAFLGPYNFTNYPENLVKEVANQNNTQTSFSSGKSVANFAGLEPRASISFKANNTNSFNVSYNKMRQNLHLVSNSVAITPIDFWKTSNPYTPPQVSQQMAVSYIKNSANAMYEFSIESYYKLMENLVDYKDGADLFMNQNVDASLLSGKGTAYGTEFMIKKNKGGLTGWVNYTYSRSFRKIKGDFPEETISLGDWFPSNFDIPNSVKAFLNVKSGKKTSFSFNFVYNQGRPITFPLAYYSIGGKNIPHFELRNQQRIPDYHRLDISYLIEGKTRPKFKSDITLGLYNVYARKNAYSIFFRQDRGFPGAFQLSVLGATMPSITYSFKFL